MRPTTMSSLATERPPARGPSPLGATSITDQSSGSRVATLYLFVVEARRLKRSALHIGTACSLYVIILHQKYTTSLYTSARPRGTLRTGIRHAAPAARTSPCTSQSHARSRGARRRKPPRKMLHARAHICGPLPPRCSGMRPPSPSQAWVDRPPCATYPNLHPQDPSATAEACLPEAHAATGAHPCDGSHAGTHVSRGP